EIGATLEKLCCTSLICSGVILAAPLVTSPHQRGEVLERCCSSDPRAGEAGSARLLGSSAQVEPPGQRQADHVEAEEKFQRQRRSAGRRDRLAETAGYEVAAAGSDRADETERRAALDAGGLHRQRPAGFALALRLAQILLAEDRGDH